MKKLVVLLVLALAVPGFAANTITVTCEDAGSGVLRVKYTVDAASESDPVGISLNFACSDGATAGVGAVTYADPCFPVYLDYAHDNSAGYDFDPVQGTPLANASAAGVPAAAVDGFSLCMGRLEKAAPAKGVERILAEIQLTQGTAASTTVTVAADALRGGVVGSTFDVTASGCTVAFAEPECMSSSHPDYDEWVAVGKPDCWCNANQCYGDADGASEQFGFGTVAVGNDDLDILIANWKKNPSGEPGICADFNHADEQFGFGRVRVGNDDLSILLANWKKNPAGDCNP